MQRCQSMQRPALHQYMQQYSCAFAILTCTQDTDATPSYRSKQQLQLRLLLLHFQSACYFSTSFFFNLIIHHNLSITTFRIKSKMTFSAHLKQHYLYSISPLTPNINLNFHIAFDRLTQAVKTSTTHHLAGRPRSNTSCPNMIDRWLTPLLMDASCQEASGPWGFYSKS